MNALAETSEPRLALAVRQPWAWLIVHGFKDVENRSWPTQMRGPIYVHASKGMEPDEYEAARQFVAKIAPSVRLPLFEELKSEQGGIVGVVTIAGCSDDIRSPWFVGKWGFALRDARRVNFRPGRGALGFFKPEGDR